MARGRMINNKICEDPRVIGLSDDTSRLAFTWLITFTDRDGRVSGEPRKLAGILFPYDDRVTPEVMEKYLKEWAEVGLIVWYEVNGMRYILFPGFQNNQIGLRYDKEAPSLIPTPDGYNPKGDTVAGVIYIIECNGLYKIGRTISIDRRLRELNAGAPYRQNMVLTYEADDLYSEEACLHAMFAKKRTKGEWFKLSKEDIETVRQRCGNGAATVRTEEKRREEKRRGKVSDQQLALFDKFWTEYPNKVAKGRALEEWTRLDMTDTLFASVMTGLEKDKKSRQWTKDDGQFIPHPSTWLHQRRWESEGIVKKKGWADI